MTIGMTHRRLAELVPEARIAVGHGQMPSSELAAIMHAFVNHEFDVLLCTTIIESGMDIPNANTILIDRADRFGIADLYQLRGRVGRSNHKAYAYLLLPSHGRVDTDARKRIGAVKQFSSLSAGFSLAVRDLEMRGAGNILGAAQSGHITAIGFGLYCQLLRRTVAQLKNQPLPPVVDVDVDLDFVSLSMRDAGADNAAVIPYDFVEDERLRMSVYRKLAECGSRERAAELHAELADRFGAVPPPMARLLRLAELRCACAEQHISRVETREGKVMFTRRGDYAMSNKRFPRLRAESADARLDELLSLAESVADWAND
jgi:transcription-repair coupling factor (superfamily II helicase)